MSGNEKKIVKIYMQQGRGTTTKQMYAYRHNVGKCNQVSLECEPRDDFFCLHIFAIFSVLL